MSIRESSVENIADLVKQVLEVSEPDNNSQNPANLWFRGQASHNYKLLPKILREENPIEQTFQREHRLIQRFKQVSHPHWSEGRPKSDLEYLFAMQHYGVPTRLLDWSESLLIAAYFALLPTGKDDDIPTLWCINPLELCTYASEKNSMPINQIRVLEHDEGDEVSRYFIPTKAPLRPGVYPIPIPIYATHNTARIVAQRGTFLIWGKSIHSLEDTLSTDSNFKSLQKIHIKGDRNKHLNDLSTLGVSKSSVFPEMTSISEELSISEKWNL